MVHTTAAAYTWKWQYPDPANVGETLEALIINAWRSSYIMSDSIFSLRISKKIWEKQMFSSKVHAHIFSGFCSCDIFVHDNLRFLSQGLILTNWSMEMSGNGAVLNL